MKHQNIQPPESIHNLLKIDQLSVMGDPSCLHKIDIALLCSVKCPASIILKTYELAQTLKEKRIGVISGFHAPVEKEVLVTLLQGEAAIVICPARSIHKMRVPIQWKKSLEQQRLLIISPFTDNQPRATEDMAAVRNQLVAALAQQVVIAYAEPGGKTEAFAQVLIATGKPVMTFETKETKNLLTVGAKPIVL